MDATLDALAAWFSSPATGLGSVFLLALVAATLVPVGSEVAVLGYVALNPEQAPLVVMVATAGNTAGGAINYWLGATARARLAPQRHDRLLGWLERVGPPLLLLAWVPVIGDPLCAAAGWARLSFSRCVAWMALGKAGRYAIITFLLLAAR